MYVNADRQGLLTVNPNEHRITSCGKVLRKLKIDEWPQFINVLLGQMSVVGPRPEVAHYVQFYTPEQRKVLSVRPGITDYASIKYFEENNIGRRINYLSVDIDQNSGYYSNYHALINMPLNRYRFNVISVEHQAYIITNEKIRDMQRDLLLSLGYSLLYRDNGDDIWVDDELSSVNGYDAIAAWHLEKKG